MRAIERVLPLSGRAIIAAAVLSLGAASVSHAAGDEERGRMSATLVTGGVFAPGRWIPIRVRLTNNSAAPIDGTVTITPGEGDNLLRVQRDVHVPPNSAVNAELVVQLPNQQAPGKKGQKQPDLAAVVWRDASGRTVATEPLTGISDAVINRNNQGPTDLPGVSVVSITDNPSSDERTDATDMGSMLSGLVPYSFDQATVAAGEFPDHAEGLDSARLMVVDPGALELFNVAQREAILSAIRGGATLVLTQPSPAVAASWLGPYLPLDTLGQRRAASLQTSQFGNVALRKSQLIGDVFARANATVIASDARGPVAAYLPLGNGRVVMTAFDVNDLAPGDAASKLWAELIGVRQAAFHDPISMTEKPQTAALLPAMIGASAPAWKLAAIVVGGYGLVVAVLLLASGPGKRPAAMVACVGVSVLLTGSLLGLTAARSTSAPLMIGRATTLDLSGQSATQTDVVTYFGQQRDDLSVDLAAGAMPSPVVANDGVMLSLWPTKLMRVGASPGKLETVWNVRRTFASPQEMAASIRFDEKGATLVTQNGLDSSLENARLLLGGVVIPTAAVPAGKGEQLLGPRNLPGVFTDSASVIAGEESKLRTQFVQALAAPPGSTKSLSMARPTLPPMLSGFAAVEGTSKLGETAVSREQSLIRTPLTLETAAVGTTVRIDPAFTKIRPAVQAGIAYSPVLNAWNDSNLTGPTLFAITPPPAVGHLKPKQLTFTIDTRAAGYHLTLRRGQCAGGKVKESTTGDIIAEWNNASGPRTATIDLTDADYDANGWIWLRANIDQIATTDLMGNAAVTGTWQFVRFDPTLIGTIDAPPQPEIDTLPPPEKPKPRPPAKPAPAKPKTAVKPSTKPAAAAPKPK